MRTISNKDPKGDVGIVDGFQLKLKTYPVLVFRALRLYVCLLLLRVVEARVLLRELRLVAIGFEQVVDVAS